MHNKWGEFSSNNDDDKVQMNDENQSEAGVLGDFWGSVADVAVGALTPRKDLHQLFDFTVQYMQVSTPEKVRYLMN